MSEDKSSLLDSIVRLVARRTLGGLTKYFERLIKRVLRQAGLYAAGFIVALMGLVFFAVGAVKWLALMMPSWLAYLMVGIVMILLGLVFAMAAFLASRS
jgi:hypothetical protein